MILPSSIFSKTKSKHNEYKNILTLYETVISLSPVSFNQYVKIDI